MPTLRKVLVKQYTEKPKLGEPRFESGFSKEGIFHSWGVGFEEFESGPGNYSMAIVEFPDGTVAGIELFRLKFVEPINGK